MPTENSSENDPTFRAKGEQPVQVELYNMLGKKLLNTPWKNELDLRLSAEKQLCYEDPACGWRKRYTAYGVVEM